MVGDLRMTSRRKRQTTFLSRYSPAEGYLVAPARAAGKPGLLDGITADGEAVIIREWPRAAKQDDQDLVEIWRNELRLLHRIAGFPGAEETIARLIDAGQDQKGFYIVILAGSKRPLSLILDDRRSSSWLRHASSPRNRRLLWENLSRIAQGVEILHAQGLIHCNLDGWSILTSGSDEPDFQLTGFEWSMRIAGPAKKRTSRRTTSDGVKYSFLGDWAAFALLAAQLLRINVDRLVNPRLSAHEVAETVSSDEIALLRSLVIPSVHRKIDGAYLEREVEKIIFSLRGQEATDNAQYQLVLGLGPNSAVSEAIREASDLSIELSDIDSQLTFVGNDLTENPRLIVAGDRQTQQYFLRGSQLVYRLSQYVVQNSPHPTWEFAKCEKAALSAEWSANVMETYPMVRASINLMNFSEAARRAPRLRGLVPLWSKIFQAGETTKPARIKREERLYRAFSTLHALELVIASTAVFPVSVLRRIEEASGSSEARIELAVRQDPERDELAATLGIRSFRERLRDLLEGDNVADDEGWVLTDAKRIGRRSATDTTLHFDEVVEDPNGQKFVFRVIGSRPLHLGDGLLVPGDFRGQFAQFSRKAHALIGLRDHSELLRMLSDPRSRLIESHDVVQRDEAFAALDGAKQKALVEITSSLPVYHVQGPPGVGKTFLVNELVRRSFQEEPSSRILLSAQSHHTVDHLMKELLPGWAAEPEQQLLAVRCRARDDSDTASPYDVQKQADKLAQQFGRSTLSAQCSSHLKQKIEQLGALTEQSQPASNSLDRRALAGLVMRSANLVFATTNSRDLERLFDERGQFDWAIIEEAAKATGSELLMPLLLSHRRLLIGDHKQLPPFGSGQVVRLLEDPGKIRTILSVGLEHIDHNLKEFLGDDLVDMIAREDAEYEFSQLCSDTINALYYFKHSVDTEIKRKTAGGGGPSIAGVLNVQHRMHPKLAKIVSDCFYGGEIQSSDLAMEKYLSGPGVLHESAVRVVGPEALTVVDMPYQQATRGKQSVERLPRYTNWDEIDAVRRIASVLKPHPEVDGKSTLAFISPYAKQVEALRATVLADPPAAAALSNFKPVARGGEYFSTVDAFQGNEADIIVVSLVRNNQHSVPKRALGFVGDPERMNVLLSRAKWRLFLVTSLEFLTTVSEPLGGALPDEMSFLPTLLDGIKDYRATNHLTILPYETLLGRTGA